MTTRLNRFYNHPGLGQGLSNLASIFAPPDPQMELAYSTIAKQNVERGGLESLYGMAADPNVDTAAFDRMGAVTGQWNPNQGFGARDMANAATLRGQDISSADSRYGTDVGASTARRGQDLTHSASIYGSDATRNAAVVGHLSRALAPGDTRPDVDPLLEAMGLPGVGGAQGLPKPMSTDEFTATIMGDAYANPEFGPGMQQGAARNVAGDFNVEQIIGPDGAPMLAPRGDAVGREPYANPGSLAAKQFRSYRRGDGASGTAVLDPNTGLATDQRTGEQLPQDAVIGEVVDTTEGLTGSTIGRAQRNVMDIDLALDTTQRLQSLIAAAPASGGLVGGVRGFIQDLIATGNEVGQLAQSLDTATQQAIDAGLIEPDALPLVRQAYDPNIPARQALTIMAATQIAKAQSPDRVSNELLQRILVSLGEGSVLANQNRTAGSLDAIVTDLQSRRNIAAQYAGPGTPPARSGPALPGATPAQPGALLPEISTPQAAAPAPMRATNPQTGEIVEWNGTAWVPVR